MSFSWSPEIVAESWAFVARPHRQTFLKLVENGAVDSLTWAWNTKLSLYRFSIPENYSGLTPCK